MKNSTLLKKWLLLIAFGIFGFSYSSAAVQADTTTIFSETLNTSLGSFTPQSLVGTQVWTWSSYSGVGFAKISGYASGNKANEDWLVSPAIDLTNTTGLRLSFGNCHKYGVSPEQKLQLMVTDSYTSGTIDTTQWTSFSFKYGSGLDYTFVSSGDVSLESFAGKSNVHFAFRYKSDTLTSAATWEVNNIALKGVVKVPDVVVLSETFNKVTTGTSKSPGSTDISLTTTAIDGATVLPGWTGSKVYLAGSALKMGTSSVPGILTTPGLDLSSNSGTFSLTFKAMAWSGDTTRLQVYVDNVLAKEINGMNADTFYVYKTYGPYEFTSGTATSKIKFTTSKAASKNCRFYLDSIVVTQSASVEPKVSVTEVAFKAEAGKSVTKKVAIKGLNLTSDLAVAVTNKKGVAFSSAVTTIAKANALAGDSIPVLYAPTAAGLDTAILVISGGGLANPVQLTIAGGAYKPIVANLAELRAAYVSNPDQTVVYTVTGPIVASYINTTTGSSSTSRSVYFQDATGGVLSYESKAALASIITPEYAIGDAVAGFTGTLMEYGKLLEFVPTVAPAASTTGNALVPVELTISEAKSMKEKYESMLVCIKGLSSSSATLWKTGKANYNFGIGSDSIVFRTNYTLMDYMDGATAISAGPTNYAGLLIEYNGTVQIVPRSKTDLGYTGPTSALKQVQMVANVYGSNGTLNVNASQGQNIEVYNLMGQRLMKSIANEGLNTYSLNKGQLYLVKVNNQVTKIIL